MDKCEGHLLIKSSENIVTRRSLSCVFFLLIDGILFICPYSIDPFRTKIKSNKTDKGNYFFYVIYSQTTVTKNLCKNLWKYFFVIFYNLLQHNYPKYCKIKTLCKIKVYVESWKYQDNNIYHVKGQINAILEALNHYLRNNTSIEYNCCAWRS